MICNRRILFISKEKNTPEGSLTFQATYISSEMKRSAHSKAVLDDSLITVDTTSLHQHKLYYCTIVLICHIAKVNSTSFVIQSPDQDIKGCVIQCLAERKSGSGHRHGKRNNKPRRNHEPRSAHGRAVN